MADGEGGRAEGGVVLAGDRQARMHAGLSAFDAAVAEAICARVAAGQGLRRVCREPGMPHRTTVNNWMAAHPAFAEALRRAAQTARIDQRMKDRQARALAAARPAHAKGGKASSYTPELGEAICDRLAEGESLISICAHPDMPAYGTVLKWVKRHADFEDMYVVARQLQADYLFDETRELAREVKPGNVWACRFKFDLIRWQAPRLAPRKYCERLVAQDAAELEQPMTVVVRKFTEDPDATPEEREALRRGKVVWSTAPGVKPGDLLPE